MFKVSSSLAPLERLLASLSRVWHCIQEAEAFSEAFTDELEDIDMAIVNKSLATKSDAYKMQNNGSIFEVFCLPNLIYDYRSSQPAFHRLVS